MKGASESLVREWMTTNVHTIGPGELMPAAYRQMQEFHIRHLPVVDHDRLVGVLSLGDARSSNPWDDNPEAKRMHAEMFMSPEPVTVGPNLTLKEAAQIMLSKHVGCLPVLEDGGILGILSETDVLRAFIGDARATA